MEKLKEVFLKIYADLLEPLRKEIIVVVDGKTYTWNSAYFEVKNGGELARKILNNLDELKII